MVESAARRLLVSLVYLTIWANVVPNHASRVNLVNNGYENLVFAIAPSTPKSLSDLIIGNIKEIVRLASPVLYVATEDRAYFRDVRILVPESWDHLEANASSWETFETADVIVAEPSANHADLPYTKQNGKCGEMGEHIYLSTNYVATVKEQRNQQMYGKPDKVFVHEWAHYRYGVFDEYGFAGHDDYPLFYRPSGSNSIVPNICTNQPAVFSTVDITTNSSDCTFDSKNPQTYDKNCRFLLDPSYKPTSSLASHHKTDSVVLFCRDEGDRKHAIDAPNKHNTMCGGASVWSVIMRSPDFANDQNKPVDLIALPLDFHIVRPKKSSARRFVLAFDVSGSMEIHNRIGKLRNSLRSWLMYDLPSGSELGIVMFSSMAHIVSEMKVITDKASREEMIKKLPTKLFRDTCIGCGLDLAAQMLLEKGKGGVIVLATDGENSHGYLDIVDVEPMLVRAGIRVVTIAIGNHADRHLEWLASKTDGKTYFVRDSDTSAAFCDAFSGALTFQPSVSDGDLHFKLHEAKITRFSPVVYCADFCVDKTVGRNLKLTVYNLEDSDAIVYMKLKSPSGTITDLIKYEANTAHITVPLAEDGTWNVEMKLNPKLKDSLLLAVTSQLKEEVKTPITTKCWFAYGINGGNVQNATHNPIKIYAEVLKGCNAVIGADVQAYIEKPNDEIEILELLDNGVNADTTLNDGVYSRYFAKPTLSGRYSVKCQVKSNGSAYESLGFIGSANPHSSTLDLMNQREAQLTKIDDNFSRITSAGSFQVEIPVSTVDAYPPADITDLSARLVDIDSETNEVSVHLRWTAPGDELDSGTVNHYVVKYSDDAAHLIDYRFDDESIGNGRRFLVTHDHVTLGSLHPEVAGAPQTVVVRLQNIQPNVPYYVAMRAVDKAHKTNQVSNMAAFFHAVLRVDNEESDEAVEDYVIEDNAVESTTRLPSTVRTSDDFLDDLEIVEENEEPGTRLVVLLSAVVAAVAMVIALGSILLVRYMKRVRRVSPYKAVNRLPTI